MSRTQGSFEQKLGLQLYTMRQQMRDDAAATLRRVADIGYTAVELAGYGNSSAGGIEKTLGDLGVEVIGAHVAYEELDQDLERAIADLQLLRATYLVVAHARPQDWSTADSVKRLAETFNAWGQRCRDAGLTLAYHGYHPIELEFAPLGDSTGYDLMVAETDPALVQLQLDTYWLRHVGRDAAQVLDDQAGRVPLLHLKDAAVSDAGGDVPVGSGAVPWPDVFAAAARGGTKWLIVEQEDDPDNAFRDIQVSLNFLLANWPPSAAGAPAI